MLPKGGGEADIDHEDPRPVRTLDPLERGPPPGKLKDPAFYAIRAEAAKGPAWKGRDGKKIHSSTGRKERDHFKRASQSRGAPSA